MITRLPPPLPKRNPLRSHRIITKEPSLNEILVDVCCAFGQSVENIKSSRQFNDYVICRRIYTYVSHVLTNKSISVIASLINRDHSTCVNHLSDCFGFFEINDTDFMSEWDSYVLRSALWREYYWIKKTA